MELSSKTKFELNFIIFQGISNALDKAELDKDTLKELVEYYKENCIISANYLEYKLESILK